MSTLGTVSLRPYVSATETESGMVLLDERSGAYWQLNATAATVLCGLLEGATTQEVTARLIARHPESAGRAAEDVASLVRQLDESGLTARTSG